MSNNADGEWELVNNPIEKGYTLVHTNLTKVFTFAIIILQIIKELLKEKNSEHFPYFKELNEIDQLRQLQQILCIITQEVNIDCFITKENVKHDFSNVSLIKEFVENQYNDFLEGRNITISNLFYCINSFHAKS